MKHVAVDHPVTTCLIYYVKNKINFDSNILDLRADLEPNKKWWVKRNEICEKFKNYSTILLHLESMSLFAGSSGKDLDCQIKFVEQIVLVKPYITFKYPICDILSKNWQLFFMHVYTGHPRIVLIRTEFEQVSVLYCYIVSWWIDSTAIWIHHSTGVVQVPPLTNYNYYEYINDALYSVNQTSPVTKEAFERFNMNHSSNAICGLVSLIFIEIANSYWAHFAWISRHMTERQEKLLFRLPIIRL